MKVGRSIDCIHYSYVRICLFLADAPPEVAAHAGGADDAYEEQRRADQSHSLMHAVDEHTEAQVGDCVEEFGRHQRTNETDLAEPAVRRDERIEHERRRQRVWGNQQHPNLHTNVISHIELYF